MEWAIHKDSTEMLPFELNEKQIFIPSIPMEYMERNEMKLKIIHKQKVSWMDEIGRMKKNKITVLYYLESFFFYWKFY